MAIFKDLFLLYYIVLSYRLLKIFYKTNGVQNEIIQKRPYYWLEKVIVCFLLVIIFDLLAIFLVEIYGAALSLNLSLLSLSFFILVIIYLGYEGYKYLKTNLILKTDLVSSRNKNFSRPFYTLSRDECKMIAFKLDALILKEKPYLNKELTLRELAEKLEISDKKLSTFLNKSLNISFYDFINKCRVKMIKEKLKDERFSKYTLDGLSDFCGFNSKSSFYRAFKKETGLSPLQFKKNLDG